VQNPEKVSEAFGTYHPPHARSTGVFFPMFSVRIFDEVRLRLFYRTRFFLVLFLSKTTKPPSSNVMMIRVCVHYSSAFFSLLCFPGSSYDEGSRPLPKVLDLRFSCFPSFMTSLLSNDYDIMYYNMYAFLTRSFAIKSASISFSMSFLFTLFRVAQTVPTSLNILS
jgi:hypothetical protein